MMLSVRLVGCGRINDIYLSNCAKFDEISVAACASLEDAELAANAIQYSVPRPCTPDEKIADPTIDEVLNLTVPAAA